MSGRARQAPTGEDRFRAQHDPVIDRIVLDERGQEARVRGVEPFPGLARLSRLRGENGAAFFAAEELKAAAALRTAFEQGQIGLAPGVDWSAPPRGSSPRGPGGAEARAAIGAQARLAVTRALGALAAPAAELVRAACLEDQGLERIERARGWPARSAKVALKLALAQLARVYASG